MSTKRILMSKDKGRFGSLQVARVCGQQLQDLEVENIDNELKVDRIYNAEVVSLQPSLEAAFVDFGSERNGFLPLKEIAPEYYPDGKINHRMGIKDVLFVGQKVLVQVNKEERGTKGAALSTYITLAGSYLVLMPNNPKAGGISRRITGEEREELKNTLAQLNIPENMGVIVRTAGMGKSIEELKWDLEVLLNLWEAIKHANKAYGAPYLIHQDSDVVIRTLRDHLRSDVGEILVDNKEIFDKVVAYIERVQPNFVDRVKLYNDPLPLFGRFQIEKQIASVFQRRVRLPSGGEIVIDRSEALTAIDVNSAQATKGEDIEETALNTNLETAVEIARQLRLRDIGGLIVIDFIDMEYEKHRRQVEQTLYDALQNDRARVQCTHISRFGLLEMSRQCLRASISDSSLETCPRCHGQGMIRNVKAQALSILRLMEDHLLKEKTNQIRVQLPVDAATYLLNEQHQAIAEIEKLHKATVVIIPNPHFQTPQYEIECKNKKTSDAASYELVSKPKMDYETDDMDNARITRTEPAVKNILPSTPAPMSKQKKPDGWLKRFFKGLLGEKKREQKKTYQHKPRYKKSYNNRRPRQKSSRNNSRGNYRRNRRSNYRDKNYRHTNRPKRYDTPNDKSRPQEKNTPSPTSHNKESETPKEEKFKKQFVMPMPAQQAVVPVPEKKEEKTKSTPPTTESFYNKEEAGKWEIVETKKTKETEK